jgi:hypothetical protein
MSKPTVRVSLQGVHSTPVSRHLNSIVRGLFLRRTVGPTAVMACRDPMRGKPEEICLADAACQAWDDGTAVLGAGMTGSKHCILAAVLSLASIYAANGQSSLPKLEPEMARELFGVYGACRAYWKVMTQCLPSRLEPKDHARLRQSFDQLQSVGVEHMKWLAAKAQLSPGMQQQITDRATSRVFGAAGGKCDNAPSLIEEYRDKCAALFQNVASAQKEVPAINQPTTAEAAESAGKFIISTCYEPIDDVSRVSSYARIKKWTALSADQKNMLRPVDSTFYDAWEVDHDGFTYIVSVNRGNFRKRPTEVCQISVSQHPEPIISRIRGTIKTRSIGTNRSGGQINDMFELVSHPSINSAMMIVGRTGDDRAFFTIAFMGIK